MLTLSRRAGERIVIGGNIVVTVVKVLGGRVSLGIQAPKDIEVLREELKLERGEGTQEERAS
jgi:carbon storage regulator